MKQIKKITTLALCSAVVLSLNSCAAISTAIKHRNLETQSKMSNSIMLNPLSPDEKTVYIQVKDTTKYSFKGLKENLREDLEHDGFTVVHNYKEAHNMIQVNVLQAGKAKNVNSVWSVLNGGYGGTIATGALMGIAAGYATGNAYVGGSVGLVSAGVSWVANQLVENVTYSMITDVQISVKVKGGVTKTVDADISQGSSTHSRQTYNTKSDYMQYKTRIASVANQVNLKFKEAKPTLEREIAGQISGILAD